jgi:ATP/maltotriose-dependent transcriptional regulator MalT
MTDGASAAANTSNGASELVPVDQPSIREAGDLQDVAMRAYLLGNDADCIALLGRGYRERLRDDDRAGAIRCAFWLVFCLLNAGHWAVARGWLVRARRLLRSESAEGVEHGYLMLPEASQYAAQGQYERTRELARHAAEIADRHDDADLAALAREVQGRAAIRLGDLTDGVALLDDAMLSLLTEEASPVVVTTVYCGLVEACQEIFDLRRAREWTEALTNWYASRPEVRLNRGRCLVHQAEVLLHNGDWSAAMIAAERACAELTLVPAQPVVAGAQYVIGELQRLRGLSAAAEAAYQTANEHGYEPQPGLALLRLAQGDVGTARAAIRRAVAETTDRFGRPKLLAAYVEILLRAGDVAGARVAAEELEEIAQNICMPYLVAMAAQARGAVLLTAGEAPEALGLLRRGWTIWQSLEVPYEAARCRVLHGLACRKLGDEEGGRMQLDAARSVFGRLGAAVDAKLTPSVRNVPGTRNGLTTRELEVLRLIARGMANRAIAEQLGLREKTVARHLSNIFAKLGLRSRSAVTAYAYEQRLI